MESSQAECLPEIKELELGETIGQGTFAFVKTASLRADPQTIVAVKFVHVERCKARGMTDEDLTREVVLQTRCAGHRHVVRVLDCNVSREYLWIAMELADGGDLFDKIEPDVGVDSEVARFYYQQLVRALTHLHEACGVAHRDIKPENMLLDRAGNLKVADFGLATRFRRRDGTRRLARDRRGTLPYLAPEVVGERAYHADTADIWSAGVLVFVLLTGETPWSEPSVDDGMFRAFVADGGNLSDGPWGKIGLVELNLLRKMLQQRPAARATLAQLRQHPWFKAPVVFADPDGMCADPAQLARRLLFKLRVPLSDAAYVQFTQDAPCSGPALTATQPVENELAHLEHDSYNSKTPIFSQCNLDRATADELQKRPATQSVRFDREVAVMQFRDEVDPTLSFDFNPAKFTKFFTADDMASVLPQLEFALRESSIPVRAGMYDSFCELERIMGADKVFPVSIDIKARDRKGWLLSGIVCIREVADGLKVVCFERKAGDPLEWRRLFKRIALFCRHLIYIA
ncbi:AEL185Cp [Eremothecium gossypii ATCC 10895]|uniref:non-specific serine/threonine protein kinase n=1 Tax=Eremothecium gossypii (strain ATCC 10895 / CBS 109.51 / FGSC 9923 / NRRL Y-1056) TaxID=284811 RepID=Q758E7_EREGS|nr:AEL185Cp [Eremothecium gossypii ATCC 10895]AAS52500.1 AEL185Cp [Eremothecium gossypii ATCC 10895]AEY96800.1 FAEL185Cp [Eremothecium gossypii FDAG1]